MAIFTDTFTDTDATANYTRTGWSLLGAGTSGARILSNNLQILGNTDGGFEGHDHGGADHYAQATLGAGAVGIYKGLVAVRATDRASFYEAAYNTGTSKWEIWDENAAIGVAGSTSTQSAGDVLRMEANGTTITLKINGSTIVTATNSGNTDTKVGFRTNHNTAYNDYYRDWESGLLSDVGGGSTFVPQVIMVL